MNKIKSYLKRNFLYFFYRKLRDLLTHLSTKNTVVIANTKFTGWGMTSTLLDPRVSDDKFSEVLDKLKNSILDGSIDITQFGDKENQLAWVERLIWRYYSVYSSIYLVATNSLHNRDKLVLVEFGVADGITASFAAAACEKHSYSFDLFLYDSFGSMRSKNLTESESIKAGAYSHLDEKVTVSNINNLTNSPNLFLCKGYLPESFNKHPLPSKIDWVSIDLNSSIVSLDVLDEIDNKLSVGSIIIFDDYNHHGFEETRDMLLTWISTRSEKYRLIHLPTGQCLVSKVKK